MEKMIRDQHTQRDRLFQLLLEIPQGKVVTYGEIARVL
jgi:alkylated DNA nucleotide flippase Atl1